MFLRALPLTAVFALSAFAQFNEVCTGGLCIKQAFDPKTKTNFGFVLPTDGSFSEDFIAQVSVPLPYGFAGFGIGNTTTSAIPSFSLLFFMGKFADDNSKLVPVDGGLITISPLSTWNTTLGTFIFRCKNCVFSEVAETEPFQLVVFNSNKQPDFATLDATNATVKTGGAKISGFAINELAALTSPDYGAFLAAAGFV
ncbi:hypothetical protein B0H13DRAFT_2273044 [Mycena leptocephala]|nr:hypothetical protein B0H13DRAFT_2273044 [Mycena leptocephala]